MPIRIDNPHSEGMFIEFKDTGWTFGARRRITEATSDVVVLDEILQFIENWHIEDINGKPIKFDLKKGIELLDEVDDRVTIPWIIQAWFDARSQRTELPKNS